MQNGRDHEGETVHQPVSGVDALDSMPSEFTVSTNWRTGPRTRAWDELWRWLLAPDEPHPSGSAGTPASHEREQRSGR